MSDDSKDLDKNLMSDHNYAGIQELDNPLPSWWLTIFLITIIFSTIYIFHYHFGGGLSSSDELASNMEAIEKTRATAEAQRPELSEKDLQGLLNDQDTLNQGQQVYQSRCASCHGSQGEGGIGPNLADNYWIHGGRLVDIAKTVSDGVPSKGMPSWSTLMSASEISQVTAFIGSLHGSQPANAKAPEGELFKE